MKLKAKNRNYKIRFYNFSPEYNDYKQAKLFLIRLKKNLPKDSTINLVISLMEKNKYQANFAVYSQLFGCNFTIQGDSITQVIDNIQKNIEIEVHNWKNNFDKLDPCAPYLGGYPAYYKEIIAT